MATDFNKTILRQIDGFPALPSTVSDVITITDNPESSAQDLMEAILPDQSMCLTILKIANSAFFGLPREVSSIDKAVMVLGFNEIRNIVLGKAVFSSFKDVYHTNREQINRFWEHSFLTGLAAKIIAEQIRLSPSETFIGGLIHDIGKLVLLISLTTDYVPVLELYESDHLSARNKEKNLFSTPHTDAGWYLLKRWLFPVSLLNSTRNHHAPLEAEKNALLPAVIGLADLLAHLHQEAITPETDYLESLLESHIPDVKTVWNDYNFQLTSDNLSGWLQELNISSDRDRAILDIITT